MRIGTRSGKSRIIHGLVTKHNANANDKIHACVTLHNTAVNDIIYDCVAPHDAYTTDHFHWASCAFSQVVLSCLHPHTHAPWLKFESFMSSPYAWSSVRSLHLDSPFLFPALLSAPFLLPQLPEVCGKPAQLLQREYGLHWRVLPLHTTKPRVVANLVQSALMHIARFMNSQAKGRKRMVTSSRWLCWRRMIITIERSDLLRKCTHQIHDNWFASFMICSRRGCHQFYGRAQTCRNQSNVSNSQ